MKSKRTLRRRSSGYDQPSPPCDQSMQMIDIDMVRVQINFVKCIENGHLVVVEVTKIRNSWFSCVQQFQADSSLRLCVRVCARVCARVCVCACVCACVDES